MVDALLPFLGKLSLRPRPCVPTKMYQQPGDRTTSPPPPVDFGPYLPGIDRIDKDEGYTQVTLEDGRINYLVGDDVFKQWSPASMTMTFFTQNREGQSKVVVKCTLDRIDNTWRPVLYEWAARKRYPKEVQVLDAYTGALVFQTAVPADARWTWRYDRNEKKTFVYRIVTEKTGGLEKELKCDPNDMDNPLEKVWVSGEGDKEEMHKIFYHPGTKRRIKEERQTQASIITHYYKFNEEHQKEWRYRETVHPTKNDRNVYATDKTRTVKDWHDDDPRKPPTYEPI